MNIIKITKGSGRVVFFRRFYLRALISFHRRNHRGKRLSLFMIQSLYATASVSEKNHTCDLITNLIISLAKIYIA